MLTLARVLPYGSGKKYKEKLGYLHNTSLRLILFNSPATRCTHITTQGLEARGRTHANHSLYEIGWSPDAGQF